MKDDSDEDSLAAGARDEIADLSDEVSSEDGADDDDDAFAEFDDAAPTVFEENELAAAALAQSTRGRDTLADRIDPPAATEASPLGQSACPDCGLTVAPGYPRCPRCKASLRLRATTRDVAAGGTSVVGRTVPWTIVAVAAIATAIVVYLAERDPPTAVADEASHAVIAADDDIDSPDATAPD